MIRGAARISTLGVLWLAPLVIAEAGTIHGTVKNGTTGKLSPGVEVVLIQLQGGMQPVAHTQSNAQGQFTFDNPGLGAQPMLIRAVYHGINFHQPAPPGKSEVEVTVFEPTEDAKVITVPTRVVFFQPNGSNLIVGEEYSVQNNSQPQKTYFRASGNFDFALPENAQLQQVAAAGPAGMPVVQAPIDKGNRHFAIAYAFRPGQNTVRYSYELPYPGNTAAVKVPSVYPAGRLLVVAPPTVQIAADGLQPEGQEQGMSIYGRENLASNSVIAINVSGTAPPDSGRGADQGAGPGSGQDTQQAGNSSGANIQQVPGRLDVLKWPLVAGFAGIFLLGAILLARKPVALAAGSDNASLAQTTARGSASPASKPVAASLADVDLATGVSLDSLKESLFRLELRHQAGTISNEEYAQERARAEKVLRDLVRG